MELSWFEFCVEIRFTRTGMPGCDHCTVRIGLAIKTTRLLTTFFAPWPLLLAAGSAGAGVAVDSALLSEFLDAADRGECIESVTYLMIRDRGGG